MSIEVMEQALAALETCRIRSVSEWEVSDVTPKNVTAAISALRTALAQQPATGEPVMDVRCEGCGYMTHHREHMGCVRAAKQHTHPAPSVPDDVARDAERYRWLRSLEHCNEAWCFIGSGNANSNLDAAIDAAMLTAAQAQKGQP